MYCIVVDVHGGCTPRNYVGSVGVFAPSSRRLANENIFTSNTGSVSNPNARTGTDPEEQIDMGILSKWTTMTPGTSVTKLDLGGTKTLSDSRQDSASLTEFLRERQLIETDYSGAEETSRKRIEDSGLVQMMLDTCATINNMVGRTVVDVHSFLPPIPILCCFIYAEGGSEYFLRLELQGAIPTLIFAERSCRDTVTNDFVRWVHRLANVEPVTINVKLVHEFQDLGVSVEQVREWFKYLISGLNRSRTPSF